MPNGALCEPWPGSVSSELAADAGAVAIRAFGEGVVPLRLPPHPLPPLAILQSRPASSVGSSDKFPHLWEVTVRCGSDTASGPARVLLSLDRSGARSAAVANHPAAAFPCPLALLVPERTHQPMTLMCAASLSAVARWPQRQGPGTKSGPCGLSVGASEIRLQEGASSQRRGCNCRRRRPQSRCRRCR
jgi:hypothetical protein